MFHEERKLTQKLKEAAHRLENEKIISVLWMSQMLIAKEFLLCYNRDY